MEEIRETQVLVIGGGATGTGIARDLALRGIQVTLVEKNDLNAGASGANHGLLHSGARYVYSDMEAARECRAEGRILKQIAPQCIEETGGLFVAVKGDDDAYIADFPRMCQKAGIPCRELDPRDALALEPGLSPDTIAAFEVEDAAIDPFKLAIENLNHCLESGGRYLDHTRVAGFHIRGRRIESVRLVHTRTGETTVVRAGAVVSATGAWAGQVAAMVGVDIPMVYSKGSLVVTGKRLSKRVINRLRKASDGDILVPGGVVSILGTTSVRVDSPDRIFPTVEEVDLIINQGRQMVPELGTRRYIRSYCGVRPLVSAGGSDDRDVTRGFVLLDHARDGAKNFITITGGKLSTFRLMAEKTADLVCEKLGIDAACRTKRVPLPSTEGGAWTEPGVSLRLGNPLSGRDDMMICECELMPASAVDAVADAIQKGRGRPDLLSISVRSRLGKGPCQGSACSLRLLSHLYDRGDLQDRAGITDLKRFLNERWKGEHALLWGQALSQSDLKESIHCGLFGLDLDDMED